VVCFYGVFVKYINKQTIKNLAAFTGVYIIAHLINFEKVSEFGKKFSHTNFTPFFEISSLIFSNFAAYIIVEFPPRQPGFLFMVSKRPSFINLKMALYVEACGIFSFFAIFSASVPGLAIMCAKMLQVTSLRRELLFCSMLIPPDVRLNVSCKFFFANGFETAIAFQNAIALFGFWCFWVCCYFEKILFAL